MDSSNGGRSVPSPEPPVATIDVPDIRDYHRINAELTQLLDQGTRHVRLLGAENQRLLLSKVAGPWSAIVEIEGNSGPELCFGMDAPGLRVVCRGSVADGVGSGMIEGKLLILGNAGSGAGVSQRGGSIIVGGNTAERAGLGQFGGTLTLLGSVAALAGERQVGGTLIGVKNLVKGPYGRGHRGGHSILLLDQVEVPDAKFVAGILAPFRSWLDPDRFPDSPIHAILERFEAR